MATRDKLKHIGIGFLLAILIVASVAATRAELYRASGPRLLDAIVQVIKDEINILRVNDGLPERTNQQIVNAVSAKLATIERYDWMNTGD